MDTIQGLAHMTSGGGGPTLCFVRCIFSFPIIYSLVPLHLTIFGLAGESPVNDILKELGGMSSNTRREECSGQPSSNSPVSRY
jgi:hypothetical protein